MMRPLIEHLVAILLIGGAVLFCGGCLTAISLHRSDANDLYGILIDPNASVSYRKCAIAEIQKRSDWRTLLNAVKELNVPADDGLENDIYQALRRIKKRDWEEVLYLGMTNVPSMHSYKAGDLGLIATSRDVIVTKRQRAIRELVRRRDWWSLLEAIERENQSHDPVDGLEIPLFDAVAEIGDPEAIPALVSVKPHLSTRTSEGQAAGISWRIALESLKKKASFVRATPESGQL